MITLKDFMEVTEYRITEGSDYGWNCYGDNAYSLSAWNGDYEGWSMNIVFDTRTQTVYEADVCDYKNRRAYRIFLPESKVSHDLEAAERDYGSDEAWDDVRYVDIDVEEDFLEKARAIVAGEDYDTRVIIPLNMPDDVVFQLMRMAHEQDITFNELLEKILEEEIQRLANEHPEELQESLARMKKSKKS